MLRFNYTPPMFPVRFFGNKFPLEDSPACTDIKQVTWHSITSTPRTRRKAMMHLCQRRDRGQVPRLCQPHVQICLIKIEMIRWINPPYRHQNITPDRHICAFCFDRLACWQPQNCGLHLINNDVRSSAVSVQDPRLPLKTDPIASNDKAANRCNVFPAKRRNQIGKPRWFWHSIVVNKRHHITCGVRHTKVTSC